MNIVVPNKRLCVYTHSSDGKIFYVGQGSSQRPYERYNRTPRWHAHVEESGGGYEVAIHCWVDDKAEALRIERELINMHAPPCNGHYDPKLEIDLLPMEPMQCRAGHERCCNGRKRSSF